jgi:hypothetical protein
METPLWNILGGFDYQFPLKWMFSGKFMFRNYSHLCANRDPIVLWWNWTKFIYVLIKLPKKRTILDVA